MTKERIEKMLIIMNEDEVRLVMSLACKGDTEAIYHFIRDVIAKKVEDALRKRCG